jgi:hypothetical protein
MNYVPNHFRFFQDLIISNQNNIYHRYNIIEIMSFKYFLLCLVTFITRLQSKSRKHKSSEIIQIL